VDTDYQADRAWLLDTQRKLYTWAKTRPADAYRDMWNWVSDPRNLRMAWRRVESNGGARSAGVDRVTVDSIVKRDGVAHFLTDTRRRLRTGAYRPRPVRRVMIPKRGKPGQFRPLGVPTVRDRVVQAAVLQVLEPIFEADFKPVSYGFRPRRACRDALEHIRNAIRPTGRKTDKDWGHFYRHCYGAKAVFTRVDHYVWDRLRRWLRKKFPKTPRLVIRRRYWRRLPGRARYRWVDKRPVAIVADLKVERHNLKRLRYPRPRLRAP
jgi:hypothetical protein